MKTIESMETIGVTTHQYHPTYALCFFVSQTVLALWGSQLALGWEVDAHVCVINRIFALAMFVGLSQGQG